MIKVMDVSYNMTEYLSKSIERLVKDAFKSSLRNPREMAFFLQCMNSVKKASRIRRAFEKQGKHIPPFLIASITSSCNLFCKGCYARENNICGEKKDYTQLSGKRWEEIFLEAEKLGVSFILLAGGEPFMRPDIIKCASKIPGIIFPVFTNGTLLNGEYIKLLDNHRNVIPILSIEGNKEQTDKRRGYGTYDRLQNTMLHMRNKRIFYGASITVTRENITTVTDEGYIRGLYGNGCRVIFYVEYVPVTMDTEELAPTGLEREYLEAGLGMLKKTINDIILISFPGDEKMTGGCLAAGRGFFHINPAGNAEPCPFSPYSDTSLVDAGLLEALDSPLFQKISHSDLLQKEHSGGCVLFNQQKQISEMLESK